MMNCKDGTFPLLRLLIEAKKPVRLHIQGFDSQGKNTMIFDRFYGGSSSNNLWKGKKWFDFPMPLFPSKLKIALTDAETNSKKDVSIKDRQLTCFTPVGFGTDAITRSFIEFASDFAMKAGNLLPGSYYSVDKRGAAPRFHVRLMDVIRSYQTGQVLVTPARVSHQNGIMEVSKRDFDKISVVNRLVILLHEYFHIHGNTTNEIDCDRFALNVALRMGFSKTECFYTLSKLFEYEHDQDEALTGMAAMNGALALKNEKVERVQRAKDFISVFQQQYG